ncbi:MAG: CopG family transcriptional regulator [Terriglobia bacterium]
MKRTQLYIDNDVWEALRLRSQQAGTSISDLVRQAVREKYASGLAYRRQAMRALAGIWKGRADVRDPEAYVRRLRKGSRLKRAR